MSSVNIYAVDFLRERRRTSLGSERGYCGFLKRAVGGGLVALLLGAAAYPFLHDAYRRYEVIHRLGPSLSEHDRAAFRAWQGDAPSFARHLYARCTRSFGDLATGCERYRLAAE